MSQQYYGKMWIATKEDLENIILKEKVQQLLKPEPDRLMAHRIFSSLYVRYIILVNNLGEIYDQTLQVQKRPVVHSLLKSATLRLRELEDELKNIELSEFIYVDQTLIEMKFIPQEIKILRPFYFPLERKQDIQDIVDGLRPPKVLTEEELEEKRIQLEKLPKHLRNIKELTPAEIEQQEKQKEVVAAVNLIKCHEKARQSRVLLYNYRNHPALFAPKSFLGPPEIDYIFRHRPGQRMFKQVKRTVYRDDFYLKLAKAKEVTLYECPETRCPNQVKSLFNSQNLFDEIIIPVKGNTTQDFGEHLRLADLCTTAIEKQKTELIRIRRNNAATVIQRAYLHYKIKKLVKRRKLEQGIMINMTEPLKWDNSLFETLEKERLIRRSRKAEFDAAFIEACQDEKAKILQQKSPWIMEDISDHIRNWFKEWYTEFGMFDKYPAPLKGGTIMVIKGQTKSVEEYRQILIQKEIDKNKSASEKKAEAEKKKEARKKKRDLKRKIKAALKKKKEDKKKAEVKRGKTWYFDDDEFITKNFIRLDKTMVEYEREWRFINELGNIKEAPYHEWISIDKYAEVHKELRAIVDEFMLIEFELLRMSLATDLKKKYKPQKFKKPKKKRRRGKGKGKRVKDITKSRPIHDLFDELQNAGIIQSYPKRSIDKFIGDLNYAAYEERNLLEKDPLHCTGDLVQAIRSAILGLGPIKVKQIRSLCLAGPKLSGKKFLAEAIASETGSVFFNLTADRIESYDDMQYLFHLITKMSRILQPSLIFIDNVHKVFYKKVPKEEVDGNPKKLASILTKIVKQIKPEDKILVLGSTNEPWKGQLGKLKKCFEKTILVPRTDYGSTYLMWRETILNKRGINRMYNSSALAMVTQGFATGRIKQAVDSVLSIRRRMDLPRKSITDEELLDGILDGTPYEFPLTIDEFMKYVKWHNKIDPLRKKKAELEKAKLEADAKNKKK